MDIEQLTIGERFALATALDDRRFELERAVRRGRANGGDQAQTRRTQIIADLDSARAKLKPLLENPSDPRPGISYKE